MKRIIAFLFHLLAFANLQTHALELVKKWELDLAPYGNISSMSPVAVGKDYSVLLGVNFDPPDGRSVNFWISGTGQLIFQYPSRSAGVTYSISSSNLVRVEASHIRDAAGEFVVFRHLNGLVISNSFPIPGSVYGNFLESTTKQAEPLQPVIARNGSKVACYILDAPEIFPKPTLTGIILKPTSATTTVTNPSDGLVALESSTNLVGWTVVAHLAPSPTPTPVTVPITNQPALFLRAREE
jgi:hypothetical protein